MKKRLTLFLMVLFCFALVYGVQRWSIFSSFESKDFVNMEPLLTAKGSFSCNPPLDFGTKDIKADEVTLFWDDSLGIGWEYIVQLPTDPFPTGSGISTTTKEVTVKQDYKGNNLQPNTTYEFYVRSDCGADGTSVWQGPFVFKTLCTPLTVLPYTESFEANSTLKDCWIVLDQDDNGSGNGNNLSNVFHNYNSSSYAADGAYSMRFYGTSAVAPHDDWLISPVVSLTATEVLRVTYHYRTHISYNNEFEVLLSDSGQHPDSFTTVLVSKTTYKNEAYKKKTVYVTGVIGDVHIGWHVVSTGMTYVYLDKITIEKVDCIGPEDNIELSNIGKDTADFEWEDIHNTQWEYYMQDAGGGIPPASGVLTNSKKVTVAQTTGIGGVNLQPNTEYEFYVRSSCGFGKYSPWIGPITFKTACMLQTLPFWEGFNTTSPTLDCWTIIDRNKDGVESMLGLFNKMGLSPLSLIFYQYEGDASMCFNGLKTQHDDWLISPTFNLDTTKYYRLRYHCLDQSENAKYRVLLSNNGTDIEDFDVVLDSKEKGNAIWTEETLIIGGVGGEVNIAWHVNAKADEKETKWSIDNVFFEEIPGCPEPMNLGSKDEEEEKVTIYWEDNFSSNWEYIVQRSRGNMPSSTKKGTATANKEIVIDNDKNGNKLESNMEYEFYVRTECENGGYSVWVGPFRFRTACKVYDTPFWEGFNLDSESVNCWAIVDGNRDVTTGGGNTWKISSKEKYEGMSAIEFAGGMNFGANLPHDDWVISPSIQFMIGKMYRLKYHYKADFMMIYDHEFEVLLSNSGTDTSQFTTTVIPKKKYNPTMDWKEEYVIISGVNGDVNIAWHVTSQLWDTYLYIDNVFIEEVTGCPEPLPVTLCSKDEKSNSAILFWDDEFGATAWEYYVQEAGEPVPTGSGTATKNKENTVSQDGSGKTLKPNTEYEFYVRTDCGNGEYSIWSGSYLFTTLCDDVYATPFWEGFNTDAKTYRCWTVIDGNRDSTSATSNIWHTYTSASEVYEGDQVVRFYGLSGKTHDDWLISPAFTMNVGRYILKYNYKTSSTISYNSSFEVLLSSQGIDTTKFTTTILPTEFYQEGDWKEKVVFFTGVAGDVNLAWHVNSMGTTYVYLDDVTLKEIETCPEPYYVTVTGQTTTSIDIEWEQEGTVIRWEVLVVDYGEDETAIPVQTVTVTGMPKTTITGLAEGTAYGIYVRARCTDGKSDSNWSTPTIGVTKVGTNNNCDAAIDIPVNDSLECITSVDVTLFGATVSSSPTPDCVLNLQNDIWLAFTATSESHLLRIKGLENSSLRIEGALYDNVCNSIGTTPFVCFEFSITKKGNLFTDLTLGQRYYIRLGTSEDTTDGKWKTVLNLCLTSSPYLEVSESGIQYTAEELVKEVLVNSDCDLVSNVHYQNGDGGPITQTVNTLGYFNKGKSDFPFKEGVVLSTGPVGYVPGPHGGSTGSNQNRWIGNQDINDVINDAGGGPRNDKRVTQLEFDFIPVTDSIHFEYLLASNSYQAGCMFSCQNAALFAAWLVDTITGEGQNIAKIPGTNLPISLNTIWDFQKIPNTSCTVNPEFFWSSYVSGGNVDPLVAPFNFAGSTIAMSSGMVSVVPGRKYHIKLAVIDFCYTEAHTSAAFFNANSFDLGNLDLGPDLLVETNNALCEEELIVIQSGIALSDELKTEIEWYKDGMLLEDEKQPNLDVNESGEYEVRVNFPELNCAVSSSIKVEIYPPISEIVHQPETIAVCRNALEDIIVNLEQVEGAMFSQSGKDSYTITYFETVDEAEMDENPLQNITDYNLGKEPQAQTVYIRVDNTETGCHEVFELYIQPQKGETPKKPENVAVCAEYAFPEVNGDQYYYTEPGGQGKEYKVGDVLAEPGEHVIYLLQLNSDEGCYEETAYQVNITAPVVADVFEDKTLSCEYYELKPLSEYNHYFTEPEGQGNELYPDRQILEKQTIYVYAISEDDLCTDESSFTIAYEDCPIPRGISPNGDNLNDVFDLTPHGVESIKIYNRWGTEVYAHGEGYTTQWHGQGKNGKQLPDGTYYYVIKAHGKTRTGWVQINK
ncbi:choice-of-anchor J domain-containing protein [Myroides indicus]|uniref:Cleaved adhesin domain-containing protein n=1 Tax=Myroides indicus TaxID=1323422 RepID=A0A4R7ENR0_9FLAO|nr:choice-of-anchor J domain-containing protein [Myroides indicus]TDS50718.1 cleaved adhesin domain-containing protein [Myroides indicus]